MKNKISRQITAGIITSWIVLSGCNPTKIVVKNENKNLPSFYEKETQDTSNQANINWRFFFGDPDLIALIDTALKNNQELNILLREIEIAKNEVKARKGEYLPYGNLQLGTGIDKAARYTRDGSVEENLNIEPGKPFPTPLGDFSVGAAFTWELDIWKKLRNAKKAAAARYLATIEGKNFMVTSLVAEIAETYYELLALDNELNVLEQNIQIQRDALVIAQQEKESAKISQLAVNRFEAQLLNTQNLRYEILQKIIETENRINFLTARFPQPIQRNAQRFNDTAMDSIHVGLPAQLLFNRPDVRKAEQELAASKFDVKSAKARFYPSLDIHAGIGFQAFNPSLWFRPESILYNLAGDLMAPLINRNAIKAAYNAANARQTQAVYNYEQCILTAYIEVLNQISAIKNYTRSYHTKAQEADLLYRSIGISSNLFNSARADYTEVLLTQRDALETKRELISTKVKLLKSRVALYKALGGGWR